MCKAYSTTVAFSPERKVSLSGSFSIYLLFKYYTRFIFPVFYIRLLIRKLKSIPQIVKHL